MATGVERVMNRPPFIIRIVVRPTTVTIRLFRPRRSARSFSGRDLREAIACYRANRFC